MWEIFAQAITSIDQSALQEQLNTASSQQEQLFKFIEEFQSRILTFLPFIIAAAIGVSVLFIMSAVNKLRVDRAILRIDKNLEKLVSEKSIKDTIRSEGNPYPNMYGPRPDSQTPAPAHASVDATKQATERAAEADTSPRKGWYE